MSQVPAESGVAAARNPSRRLFLKSISWCAGAVLLSACAPRLAGGSAGTARPSGSAAGGAAWSAVVDAARQEGAVNVYGALGAGMSKDLPNAFESAYPGIKVNGTYAPAGDLISRILAERNAGKFLVDAITGPATQSVTSLKPVGAVAPLEPALLLPEVTDLSAWLDKHWWWIDSSEPNTTLAYQGYVGTTVSGNTKMVDLSQFTSYWDILDPKWHGKIVSYDVRRPGQGGVQMRFIYRSPELGSRFVDRLFRETGIVLSTDHRQMVDWLAQGRYQIGLWVSSTYIKAASDQGLPVAEVPGDQLKEGAPLSVGGGTINLADSPPHPNAARVFINWLLTREGQTLWQKAIQQPSLRLDVAREGLDPNSVPKPDRKYVFGGSEDFMRTSTDDIVNIINRALKGEPAGTG